MTCERCGSASVIDRPYAGDHPCAEHFRSSVVERFRREMHRQFPRFRGGTVAVAVSGGKDSATALALSVPYFARRPGVRVVALSIDEGIPGYRPPGLVRAGQLAERLGVEHRIVRAAERVGTTTSELAERFPDRPPCGPCGVLRRRLLNEGAQELGADVLVLGFNLDDLAQTVLMNVARGEPERLARMAPHRERRPGFVPRIAPLARVPEREVFTFALLEQLPFDPAECPHAGRAARNVFREALWRLEEALPGTRQSLLASQERLAEALVRAGGAGGPGTCERCGAPSSGPLCRACELLDLARNPFVASARSSVDGLP